MAAKPWTVAKSLLKLRDQVNHLFPGRNKSGDGTIGDAAHAASKSDHNPNEQGLVLAMDITHDPGKGANMGRIAEALRQSRDPRIKYVIWNGQMFASYVSGKNEPAWEWRPYTGKNKHDHHMHVSVNGAVNSEAPWRII